MGEGAMGEGAMGEGAMGEGSDDFSSGFAVAGGVKSSGVAGDFDGSVSGLPGVGVSGCGVPPSGGCSSLGGARE